MSREIFNIETDDDLMKVLQQSIFLAQIQEGNTTKSLFSFSGIYIETLYSHVHEMYIGVFPFTATKFLNTFLNEINLNDIREN